MKNQKNVSMLAWLLLCGSFLLVGCKAPGREDSPSSPTIWPASTAITSPMVVQEGDEASPLPVENSIESEVEPPNTFVSMYSSFWVSKSEPCTFYGVRVNGSREDTVLEAGFTSVGGDESNYNGAEGEIRLYLANGEVFTAKFETALYSGSTCGFSLRCVDLDGDDTDEICLFYEYWNTANLGDLHIYKIMPGGLAEIGAALTGSDEDIVKLYKEMQLPGLESCAGAVPMETNEGIVLRIYEYAHVYNTRYAEYTYRDGKWNLIRPAAAAQEHNPPEEALRRWGLYDFSAPMMNDEEPFMLKTSKHSRNVGLDIDGKGLRTGRLYVYEAEIVMWDEATQEYIEPDIILLEYEREYGSGERVLLGYFEGLQLRHSITVDDADGDGAEEITLLLRNSNREEVRVWKAEAGQMKKQ